MAKDSAIRVDGAVRRTERVRLRIPIEVEGQGMDGEVFKQRAYTLVLNRDGARICMEYLVPSGETVAVTNLQTGLTSPFRIVGPMQSSAEEGLEWGIECLKPEENFWGIYFPSGEDKKIDQEVVDALVQCSSCESRELAKLTLEEYRTLSTQNYLQRDCAVCGDKKEWEFGYVRAIEQGAPPSEMDAQELATEAMEKRRTTSRIAVKLPVHIRLQNGREEVTRTENLSKTGVCFVSDLDIKTGDYIRITLGYEAGSPQAGVVARVVWRRPLEGSDHFTYGVHLEESPETTAGDQMTPPAELPE